MPWKWRTEARKRCAPAGSWPAPAGAPVTSREATASAVPGEERSRGFAQPSRLLARRAAHERAENIHNAWKEGQVTKVKVISVIPEERKLGLSIKRVGQEDDEFSGYDGGQGGATTIGDLVREKLGNLNLNS